MDRASIRWNDEARGFVETYDFDPRLVEDVVLKPVRIADDPRANQVGYPIKRMRRGDIEVVVGFREPDEPTILYVRLATPDDDQRPMRGSGGGAKGSNAPRSTQELIKRVQAQGYTVTYGGHHKVYKGTTYVMSIPSTPSDVRSVMNSWRDFVKKHQALQQQQKEQQ